MSDSIRWKISLEDGAYGFQSLRGAMQGAKDLSAENHGYIYQIINTGDGRSYIEFKNGECIKDLWHNSKSKKEVAYWRNIK